MGGEWINCYFIAKRDSYISDNYPRTNQNLFIRDKYYPRRADPRPITVLSSLKNKYTFPNHLWVFLLDGYFHKSFLLVTDQAVLIRHLRNELSLSFRQKALVFVRSAASSFTNSNARFSKGWIIWGRIIKTMEPHNPTLHCNP